MADDPCRGKELLLSLVPPSLSRPEGNLFCHFPSPAVPFGHTATSPMCEWGRKLFPLPPLRTAVPLAMPETSPPFTAGCPPSPALRAREGGGQMSAALPLVRQGRVERGRASPIMSFHRCLHRNRRSPERKRKKAVSVGRLVQWTSGGEPTSPPVASPPLHPSPVLDSPVHHTLDKKKV